jgi:uncharacterized protein
MNDGEFEWDDRKAALNRAKHGVQFDVAKDVFEDIFAIEQLDDSENYGEDRFSITGLVGDKLLFVVYTLRGKSIRIISARGARPQEHRQYHEANREE